jgi:hypothetical protein
LLGVILGHVELSRRANLAMWMVFRHRHRWRGVAFGCAMKVGANVVLGAGASPAFSWWR